ncbi:MAG: helix-turn-helix domain protein [Candidatus Saccharibacteria bacterium]|nr:helix-turn-helix domain protein [Candidatus Saccharibacteria bacterium]
MDWDIIKAQLLEDPKLREAYNKIDLPHAIGKMIIDARIAKNMTQARLAELVGTKQPGIARLEKGNALPSLSLLQKIANAFNTRLLPPRFEFLEQLQSAAASFSFHHIYGGNEWRQPVTPYNQAIHRDWNQDYPLLTTTNTYTAR